MKIRMGKGSWMAVLVFLTIVFMVSLWTIDVSVSAMNVSAGVFGEAKLTNGFWIREPVKMYHMGLWLAVASFFTTVMITIKMVLGGESCDEP